MCSRNVKRGDGGLAAELGMRGCSESRDLMRWRTSGKGPLKR